MNFGFYCCVSELFSDTSLAFQWGRIGMSDFEDLFNFPDDEDQLAEQAYWDWVEVKERDQEEFTKELIIIDQIHDAQDTDDHRPA
jgi:predicted DNA-binding WGR domain protein